MPFALDSQFTIRKGTVSHKYLKVFSQHQVYTFTARTDDDFDYWDEPIATIQKACLGETEYERREQAAHVWSLDAQLITFPFYIPPPPPKKLY